MRDERRSSSSSSSCGHTVEPFVVHVRYVNEERNDHENDGRRRSLANLMLTH